MSNNGPFFSILMTTFTRENLLKQSIDSVLDQSFDDYELLIGNDNHERAVQSLFPEIVDPRIKWINHKTRKGYFGNINRLIDLSTGEYVTTLSDDDLLNPFFLEKFYHVICENKNVKVIFSDYQCGDEYKYNISQKQAVPVVLSGKEWILGYTTSRYKAIGCYGVFEKSFLSEIGGPQPLGKDQNNSPYNDNLLAVKAGLADNVFYIPEKLVFFRSHDSSPSSTRTDADAYSTAQADFLLAIKRLLKNNEHRSIYNSYLRGLVIWFSSDYFCVVSRGKKLNILKIIHYYNFILSSTPSVCLKIQYFTILNEQAIKALVRRICKTRPVQNLLRFRSIKKSIPKAKKNKQKLDVLS